MQPPPRTNGGGGVSSSQAVVRVTPVEPKARSDVPSQLLGRSGLDLYELLATTDLVTPRQTTGNVALDVGLENARSALLRNLPGDALAALDGVWDAAKRTEEGWYLRSGALLVLGLPGESDRVVNDGLDGKPLSNALRFIQSLARLAVGDASGARATLQVALERLPTNVTLMVQQVIVQAKHGDRQSALDVFAQLQESVPDHPSLAWGRAALRAIVTDTTRRESRPTPVDWPSATSGPDGGRMVTPNVSADVASGALERFGASAGTRPSAEIAREARLLLRAFSAGGTLVASATAEQAHAARVILSAFVAVTSGEGHDPSSTMHALVSQLLPLIQRGQFDEAERVLRRHSGVTREPIGRLLLAVLLGGSQRQVPDGATIQTGNRSTPVYSAAMTAALLTPETGMGIIRDEVDRGAVVPVRLGLGLLEETAVARKRASGSYAANQWAPPSDSEIAREIGIGSSMAAGGMLESLRSSQHVGVSLMDRITGRVSSIPSPEERGQGWGAAHAAAHAAASSHPTADWAEGAGIRAIALVCVMLAAGSLIAGYAIPAIALGVGGVWLGLRRSGRDGHARTEHDVHQSGNEPEKTPESGSRR